MEKIKSRQSLINKIIKPIFWAMFVIGIGIIIIGITQFIMTGRTINDEIVGLSEFNDKSSAVTWTKNISELVKSYNNDFQFILIGILVAILARITSKPLLIGGTFFSFASSDNEPAKKNFKGNVVITTIFLTISLLIGIFTLVGIYQLLLPVESFISASELIINQGIPAIENLPNNDLIGINNHVNAIVNNLKDSLGNLDPKIIVDKSFAMFIIFIVGIISWLVVETTHLTIVLWRKRRSYDI